MPKKVLNNQNLYFLPLSREVDLTLVHKYLNYTKSACQIILNFLEGVPTIYGYLLKE